MEKKINIALICLDKIGKNMAGPGIRYLEMAKALSKEFAVTLLVPEKCDLEMPDGVTIKVYDLNKPTQTIFPLIKDSSHVIAQSLRPPLILKIKQRGIKYIADLYDPLIVETLEYFKYNKAQERRYIFDFHLNFLLLQLYAADHIICASDRQRNFYTGLLFDRKIINPTAYSAEPNINSIISLAPFGLQNVKPKANNPNLISEKFPGITQKDKVIYWGGGVWNWFDPLTVIKAVEKISKERDDVKLFFVGIKHPNPQIKEMEMAKTALDYCREHNLLDKFVFFNFGWTPYEERINYLVRAHIGVSAHFENLETHLSFRTRILDYLWAQLPMVVTKGDVLAELVESKELGRTVDYKDVNGFAKAITELLNDNALADKIKANINDAATVFTWESIMGNLTNVITKMPQKQFSRYRFARLLPAFYFSGFKKKFLAK